MKSIKNVLTLILVFIILSLCSISYSYDSSYTWSSLSDTLAINSSNTEIIQENNNLNLESNSAILIEQSSGQILYSHNIHEKLRPASVTKIMSILLIMEQIESGALSYDDKITCSETASSMGGSQIWLSTKENLTVDEMLKAICIVSANDCVVAMAEHIAGSEEAFVQMMNDKAKTLGMYDTNFKNCHGIDEDDHYSSAYDISLMSRELLEKYPGVTKYTTIWMDSLRDGKSELVNTNKLIRTYNGITGLKTGSTSLALYNLSASATRDDLSLIAVVMKSPSSKVRFAEAQKLLDYGFSKFTLKNFGNKNDVIQSVNIKKGIVSYSNVVLKDNANILIEKGKENQIIQNIEIKENIEAPLRSGDIIGKITFSIDDKILNSFDLISSSNIEKINIFTMSKKIIYSWFNLLRT